ncbi:putative nuclease HARBI1 [Rhagoletis pomonella]|uniref:putative nuclease HARBI1 n=1 Tax=Rhagoletis pomonella TaxID=28610 RepID=UPI00177D499C|nr:putative nuclease HARBI1 [Rhagoletis pomonella]XP_036320879.1 putative nuclease HARBI1 [Rhagoletis pomonella]
MARPSRTNVLIGIDRAQRIYDEDHNNRRPYIMLERRKMHSWDDFDFFSRFRMTKARFVHVLHLIVPYMPEVHQRQRYISHEVQLLCTLRFLAAGSMQSIVGDIIGVSQPTISNLLPKVCKAVLGLLPDIVRMPRTQEELKTAAALFYMFGNLPRVIGAIDCTHIKIQSPGGPNAEIFRNRKGYFSLNVQTVAAANLKIMNIVTRWQGSAHDSTIFRSSALWQQFEAGEFRHYILVGDPGYANSPFLATPFAENSSELRAGLQHVQEYQRAIIATRNCLERSYGVLKRRFPALAYGLRVKTSTAQMLVATAAVLHNICFDENEQLPNTPPGFTSNEIEINSGATEDTPNSNYGRNVRNELLDMFRHQVNTHTNHLP